MDEKTERELRRVVDRANGIEELQEMVEYIEVVIESMEDFEEEVADGVE